MSKAGGIIGIIAGIFGCGAAMITLLFGGLGGALGADSAATVIGLGWGGVAFSFLAIIFGAMVFAKPKGAGIALILVSVGGAILGGTLVAICMALCFIGGLLAVFGAKSAPTPAAIGATSHAAMPTKSGRWVWVTVGCIAVLIVFAVVGVQGSKNTVDPIAELEKAKADDLQPFGELSDIFALGSDSTNLQRENKTKEITGKVIQWKLPVYEVAKDKDGYRIQTKQSMKFGVFGQNLVGTFIRITPRNDAERQAIEAMKTGDVISFKGRIAGSMMRSVKIEPALLAVDPAPIASATPMPALETAPIANTEPAKPANAEAAPLLQPPQDASVMAAPAPIQTPVQPVVVEIQPQKSEDKTVESSGICKGLDLSITADMLDCSNKKLASADRELNVEYKRVMSNLDDPRKASLKKEQIAWIKEKEAKCPLEGKQYEGGSMEAVTVVDCKAKMTENRLNYLQQYL